jgi:hypothetical protein
MLDKFSSAAMYQQTTEFNCAQRMPSQDRLPREHYFQLLESARSELTQLQKVRSPKAAEVIATIQQLVNLGEARGLL